MTWANVKAQDKNFGAEQTFLQRIHATGNYPVDRWSDLMLTEAKSEIERDFRRILRLDANDADQLETLDTFVDDNTADIRDLLAVKQLELVYVETDAGDGSLNRSRKTEYSRKYQELLSGLPGLLRGDGSASVTSHRIRF